MKTADQLTSTNYEILIKFFNREIGFLIIPVYGSLIVRAAIIIS